MSKATEWGRGLPRDSIRIQPKGEERHRIDKPLVSIVTREPVNPKPLNL